jgi:hypothetical protein
MLVSLLAAAAAQRSTHDVVYAAIIAASAAIVGGIIGGTIPGYFMLKAEGKRQAHARDMAADARRDEVERERRAVIGTARALYEFFDRIGMIFEVTLTQGRWWSDKIDATLQPPSLDDQRVVLGQLTLAEAGVVATSMRAIEMLRGQRGSMMEAGTESGEGAALGEVATRQVKSGRQAAQDATNALRRVAEFPRTENAQGR